MRGGDHEGVSEDGRKRGGGYELSGGGRGEDLHERRRQQSLERGSRGCGLGHEGGEQPEQIERIVGAKPLQVERGRAYGADEADHPTLCTVVDPRRLKGTHVVNRRAERPDVGGAIIALTLAKFRTHVHGRAASRVGEA